MTKAQDQRLHSMKEQAYNENKDQYQDQDSRSQRQCNLKESNDKEFKDLASEEIVSLKILSQIRNLDHLFKWRGDYFRIPTCVYMYRKSRAKECGIDVKTISEYIDVFSRQDWSRLEGRDRLGSTEESRLEHTLFTSRAEQSLRDDDDDEEEEEIPTPTVTPQVIGRKRVYSLVDESDTDEE
ncbi:hypothetical protein Tco_0810654 [Tanacetum coccineum]